MISSCRSLAAYQSRVPPISNQIPSKESVNCENDGATMTDEDGRDSHSGMANFTTDEEFNNMMKCSRIRD